MPPIRVLYDISELGMGQVTARGGSYRADQHLIERLHASPDCELLFCANHSNLAYEGCVEYLRQHERIAGVPLLHDEGSRIRRRLRRAITAVHRRVKIVRGGRALPRVVRASGALLAARVSRPVVDATPPVDIFHSSTTPLPPRPRRGRSPLRFITIYDLRASRFPASQSETEYEQALVSSVQAGDWVITSSEATRHELCEHGVASERIVVTPLAADRALFHPGECDADPVKLRYGIPPGPFLLMLYDPSPRKNLMCALEAFRNVVQQERVTDLTLVLAGLTVRRSDRAAALIDRTSALRGRVVKVGYVPDEDLASLYRNAIAFVYPSMYEGFGLPPLEAMQCGTPVITSNSSSLPEIVGDAGIMVDRHDQHAMSAAMLALYRDGGVRESLRRKCLARSASFSWERTAARTIAGYRAALDA